MKISDFLTSPPPATGWSLDSTMAVVVRRQSKGELRSAAVDVPDGTFEVGPVGLQAVDEEKLRPVLARLQDEVEGTTRAAVVVPTGWLRTHILEFEQLPRRQADLREMVLWRLKKLLPVAPTSLRLATVTQPPSEGHRRLLILVGVERAIAGLESVFESVGVSPGLIAPRVFAVADGKGAASRVLAVQQEMGFLSIMLLVNDQPKLVRTKPLPESDWSVVERELSLTLGFVRTSLEIEGVLDVGVSVENEMLGDRVKGWIAADGTLSQMDAAPPLMAFDGTAIRDRVGSYRLNPVINLMSGAVR
jgi:hypothetical protein